jgi:hypothetical protein
VFSIGVVKLFGDAIFWAALYSSPRWFEYTSLGSAALYFQLLRVPPTAAPAKYALDPRPPSPRSSYPFPSPSGFAADLWFCLAAETSRAQPTLRLAAALRPVSHQAHLLHSTVLVRHLRDGDSLEESEPQYDSLWLSNKCTSSSGFKSNILNFY